MARSKKARKKSRSSGKPNPTRKLSSSSLNQKVVKDLSKEKKSTISLSIIVKNESKVIERMLNTVWPILDYYVVVDTGSTDGTQDIVRNFFKEKGIPGEVIEHPWVNFEDARTKALVEVKDKADFGFWIDADEQLIIDPNFDVDLFKRWLTLQDGALCKISYGSQNYFRQQFFSTTKPWRWYGPVHEVLMCDEKINVNPIEGMVTLVTPDGNSWTSETQQQKYEGHAKILEEYIKNDPKKDPRWVFYLAQSYRDANTPENLEKAIEQYKKRSTMTSGFWEENYFSALMVAAIMGKLAKPPEDVLRAYLEVGKYNTDRVEHLIPVILHYHSIKEFDTAYIFSSHAMKYAGKNPSPKSSLFIDPSVYAWKIYDLHSLSAYYSGRKEEAIKTFNSLMKIVDKKDGTVPENEVKRLIENKKFFK